MPIAIIPLAMKESCLLDLNVKYTTDNRDRTSVHPPRKGTEEYERTFAGKMRK
jgi:hypothetical protein